MLQDGSRKRGVSGDEGKAPRKHTRVAWSEDDSMSESSQESDDVGGDNSGGSSDEEEERYWDVVERLSAKIVLERGYLGDGDNDLIEEVEEGVFEIAGYPLPLMFAGVETEGVQGAPTIIDLAHAMDEDWAGFMAERIEPENTFEAATLAMRLWILERRQVDGETEYQLRNVHMTSTTRDNIITRWRPSSVEDALLHLVEGLQRNYERLLETSNGSGWEYVGVTGIRVRILQINPPRIGNPTEPPPPLFSGRATRGFIDPNPHANPKSDPRYDNTCFINACLACVTLDKKDPKRNVPRTWDLDESGDVRITKPDSYPDGFPNTIFLDGVTFPITYANVGTFMDNNPDISVSLPSPHLARQYRRV